MADEGTVSSDDKLFAALCYWGNLFAFVPALIIFLVKHNQSSYIKSHAIQSIFLTLAVTAFMIVFMILISVVSVIPFLGAVVAFFLVALFPYLSLLYWVYSGYLGYLAFQGKEVDIPYLTSFVRSNLGG